MKEHIELDTLDQVFPMSTHWFSIMEKRFLSPLRHLVLASMSDVSYSLPALHYVVHISLA